MPIYEYKCPACNKTFALILPKTDSAPRPCPDCKGLSPKIFSIPSKFQWK